MSPADLEDGLNGWTPHRVEWDDGLKVDWCDLGARRFVEPFFYETLTKALSERPTRVRQRRTGIAALEGLPPGAPLAGFIFHMARCGSTLCAQALAADPAHIVIAEAAPLRAVLRAAQHGPATPGQIAHWLAGMVKALTQPRFGETRAFVKFMAADVLDIATVAEAFPTVPWLFLYRDPLAILASQRVVAGIDAVPGQIPPARLGLTRESVAAMPPHVYQCHVMAALGQAALNGQGQGRGRGMVLNYARLPDALWSDVPHHFGLRLDTATRAAMRAVAARDAKRPDVPFVDGAATRDVPADWRTAVEAIVAPTIAALDRAAAQACGFAGN